VSLIAVEELSSDKPLELMNTCLIRARFCENLGHRLFGKAGVPDCFITGMFSVLDAILDQPMRELTSELNLNNDVRLALEGEASPLLPALDLIQALEAADWEKIQSLSAALGIEISEVMDLHTEAIEWTAQSQQEAVTA
jgi:EAL and modified HD-GYP domain-containing signal transduction protein